MVDVTLDVDTAHNHLFISKDLRRVRCAYLEQKRRVCPERFSCSLCVLGTPRLTSGRHYWEVDVGTSAEWNLGVCKESVSQQEKVVLSSELGFWTLSCRQKDTFLASTEQMTELMVSPRLHRVGVFLDVEMGTISFYHVGDGSHIFTFPPISAAEPLRPFFAPGSPVMDGGSFLMLCPGLRPSVSSAAGCASGCHLVVMSCVTFIVLGVWPSVSTVLHLHRHHQRLQHSHTPAAATNALQRPEPPTPC
ncbi:ret finger protein-like 4A [Desmodus rotundus]|uniref:ret finger protein-like 4A n=1 Tax=Desmodus rotundus TaxID=9430 RepID=UPI0023817453|nr:ret finger protein-like 4A [Desmodus rotundus]